MIPALIKTLTTNLTIFIIVKNRVSQFLNTDPLLLIGRMRISFHCDRGIGMSQNLAQGFYIHPGFQCSRGECVSLWYNKDKQ